MRALSFRLRQGVWVRRIPSSIRRPVEAPCLPRGGVALKAASRDSRKEAAREQCGRRPLPAASHPGHRPRPRPVPAGHGPPNRGC